MVSKRRDLIQLIFYKTDGSKSSHKIRVCPVQTKPQTRDWRLHEEIDVNVNVRNTKDLYGKGLILQNFDKMKIIIVLASICVLSC